MMPTILTDLCVHFTYLCICASPLDWRTAASSPWAGRIPKMKQQLIFHKYRGGNETLINTTFQDKDT